MRPDEGSEHTYLPREVEIAGIHGLAVDVRRLLDRSECDPARRGS